jgi:peptidoglycan/LPS O-acetylase OafA/YrhL
VTTLRPRPTPSGYHETLGELRGLTGLRIVAAAWVVFFHFHFTPLPGVAEVVALAGPLLTAGALGVDLFFVLSGFVIAYTYLDQLGPALRAGATARFVWARACRLWPAYALVFHLFGLWLAARLYFGSGPQIAFQAVQPVLSVGEYLQQLVMVQLWDNPRFDGASWVGSTWSISAEWLAYLLFPVAALGFFRLRNLPAAVLGVLAVAAMAPMAWAYLTTGSPYFDWSWLVRILSGFGAGVLAYLAVRRLRGSGAAAPSARVRAGASVLAAALPVLIAAGLLAGELLGPGRGGAVLVVFPLLVGALAVADRGPALVLSAPWAVYGGRISYCLYLVHIPMLELYWFALQQVDALGPRTWLAHLTGLAVVASTFVLAAGAFRLVEEPARRRLRRMTPRLSGRRPKRASAPGPDPMIDHEPGPAFPAPGRDAGVQRPSAVLPRTVGPEEAAVASDEVRTDRFAAVLPVRPPTDVAGRQPGWSGPRSMPPAGSRDAGPGGAPVRPARPRPAGLQNGRAPSPFPRAGRRDPATRQPRHERRTATPSPSPARPADPDPGSMGIGLFEPAVRPHPYELVVDPAVSPLLAALVHAEGRRSFS